MVIVIRGASNIIEYLPHTGYGVNILQTVLSNPQSEVWILATFFRWGNCTLEKLNNLSKFTHPVSAEVGRWTQTKGFKDPKQQLWVIFLLPRFSLPVPWLTEQTVDCWASPEGGALVGRAVCAAAPGPKDGPRHTPSDFLSSSTRNWASSWILSSRLLFPIPKSLRVMREKRRICFHVSPLLKKIPRKRSKEQKSGFAS